MGLFDKKYEFTTEDFIGGLDPDDEFGGTMTDDDRERMEQASAKAGDRFGNGGVNILKSKAVSVGFHEIILKEIKQILLKAPDITFIQVEMRADDTILQSTLYRRVLFRVFVEVPTDSAEVEVVENTVYFPMDVDIYDRPRVSGLIADAIKAVADAYFGFFEGDKKEW